MDKNAIKKYAVWARRELILRVTQRALKYGISEKEIIPAKETSIHGVALSPTEIAQRTALIDQISNKGFEQVMEEVAYTWFNRFSALRFMEVNGYLPTHVRVFTDDENNFKPQIMAEAINLEMDGLDMEKVYAMKDANDNDALFKYLIITQCNALSSILPGMFQKIDDYTELLFPDNLLREGSVIEQMISLIPEDDWKDQVQIIGWLYQYYISEKHEEVVNPLYGKGIKKEDIPAATQLFTTDWIVKYMVDNSLGRYWIERNPNSSIRSKLDFLVSENIEVIEEHISPENIKFFDPCMGSGHILAYAFDVFVEIYRECGYTDKEAVICILNKNLFGLDIDDRAGQLAFFTIMMKARSLYRRLFSLEIQTNVFSIKESDYLPFDPIYTDFPCTVSKEINEICNIFRHAKEVGSLIHCKEYDFVAILQYLSEFEKESINNLTMIMWNTNVYNTVRELICVAQVISQKYNIVCTNPPYMNNLKGELKKYILNEYKDYSGDIFSAFIMRNMEYTTKNGYIAFMTPNVWMYIKSFEKLREYIISQKSIISFLLLAKGAFYKEATVDICTFVLSNERGRTGDYVRLEDYKGDMDKQKEAFLDFDKIIQDGNYFCRRMEQFSVIPGKPIAFWISDTMLDTFYENNIEKITTAKAGIVSGNDSLFLKHWYEVSKNEITFDASSFSDKEAYRWVPINKGGAYRRYYGNYDYIINIYDLWNSDKVNESVRRSEPEYYFKKAMTWSYVTTGKSSFRITENKTSATASPNLFFSSDDDLFYTLAFVNSCIAQKYLDLLNPTINLNVTNVSTLPLIVDTGKKNIIINKCKEMIKLCKDDWDSREVSWDFQRHPLISVISKNRMLFDDIREIDLAECYCCWENECSERFIKLKSNEEELNRIFIDIYGLQNELIPEIEDKDITIIKADLQRDVKSLISFAVGCMFGRYSLTELGLIYAGGQWDECRYFEFDVDKDNIIPICDDEYFDDDIVNRFVDFIRFVYGEKSLESNLKFIANALGGKGQIKEVIRNYFVNDFYAEHLRVYQKTPIYWLFDSGKKNGFKCLIYMHRYQPDTIARIRTDYVHEQQSRYRTSIADLEKRVASASASEKVKLSKQLSKLQDQAAELHEYEEKIHHLADQYISIDLDDGVKVNYAKFQDVLAKIK